MIELKKNLLTDLKISEISIKDHILMVTLTGNGEYIACIAEPGRKARMPLPDNVQPMIGDASLAHAYALFKKK